MSPDRRRLPKTEPVVVADWDALDADIAAFIERHSSSPRSVVSADAMWRAWEQHCAELGVDPLNAPMSAFDTLWTRLLGDGTVIAPSTVSNIASAVAGRYAKEARVPAHQRPENRTSWLRLGKAARKAYSKRVEEGQTTREPVVPLMRAEAVQLMNTRPSATPYGLAVSAALLMLLDSELTVADLPVANRDDVNLCEGFVSVLGAEFRCDHSERVRGIPWDCTACALRTLAEAVPAGAPLFADGPTRWRKVIANTRTRLPGLAPAASVNTGRGGGKCVSSQFHAREDLTAWELAGLRRALVLRTRESGLRWLRARAWTGMSWTCGFRMGSDLDQVARDAAAPDRAGRGWSVRLRGTKGDQTAADGVLRPFSWAGDDGVCVAVALAEYACVRDAMLGREGMLLVGVAGDCYLNEPLAVSHLTGTSDLVLLCELAGVEPVYTSYSTRKGYGTQAANDGMDLEDIQAGLRHKQLSTAVRYVAKRGSKAVGTKFIGSLAEEDTQ